MICVVDVKENFARMEYVAPVQCKLKFIEAPSDSADALVKTLCKAIFDDECEVIIFPWILLDTEAVKKLIVACTNAGAKTIILPVWPDGGLGACIGMNGHYDGLTISESMVIIACKAQKEKEEGKEQKS